jgi:hypothetical protein
MPWLSRDKRAPVFECSFSRRIWRVLMADSGVVDPPVDWNGVVSWFKAEKHRNSHKIAIYKLCLGAAIYYLWRQQNDLLHGNSPQFRKTMIFQIKWQVWARLLAKGSVKLVGDRIGLIHIWNLHTLIRL